MKSKLFYLAFLVTLIFAVFSQSEFSFFLLGFEFLLAVALFICARLLGRWVGKTMGPPESQALRHQEIPLEVQLENRCGLPIAEVQVELRCRDEYSGKVERLKGTAMLDARDETALRFIIQANHYGILTVWPERIRIGDPLGVYFAARRFRKQMWEIAVLPELVEVQEQQTVSEAVKRAAEEGEGISGRGEDPSTAYELRAYQEGEPLRNVHWKMTAKTDEIMVKEFDRDTEPMALVFLDLDCGGKEYSRRDWDAFLEVVASFEAAQIHAGNHFEVFWLDGQGVRRQVQVRDEGDAKLALTALMHEKPRAGTAGEMAYKEKLTHEAYDAVVCIDLWGKITRAEEAR